MISVKADIKEVEKYLTRIERKQIPFATALSLTKTAQHVKSKTLVRIFPRIFDRPTKWIAPSKSPTSKRGGFYIKPATKRDYTAGVFIKDEEWGKIGTPAFNVLKPQIEGGRRKSKSHEKKLRALGILGDDEYTVPGDAMRLDRFGNLTRATYSKILADVQGSNVGFAQGFGQATTKRGKKQYFYSPNLKPRGIYRRISRRRLVVALLFIRAPRYKSRFDFIGISTRAARKRWPIEFQKALDRALKTAR